MIVDSDVPVASLIVRDCMMSECRTDEKIRELVQVMADVIGEFPEIVCAYLFGSILQTPDKAQDIDVAVQVDRTLSGVDVLPTINKVYECLKEEMGRTDIDVVPLNDTPHNFRHEVIATGKCIYARSEEERVGFEVKSELAYYDFRPLQKMFDRVTLQYFAESE